MSHAANLDFGSQPRPRPRQKVRSNSGAALLLAFTAAISVAIASIGSLEFWWFTDLSSEIANIKSPTFDWKTRRCISQPTASNSFQQCGNLRDSKNNEFIIAKQSLAGISVGNSTFSNFVLNLNQIAFSQWQNVDLKDGKIWETNFYGAKFTNVTFDDIDWRGAQLGAVTFEDCVFKNSRMSEISFHSAKFIRSRLENVTCLRCNFVNTSFENSVLSGDFTDSAYNLTTRFPFSWSEAGQMGFVFRD